jgi:hypothetical protein
MKRLSCGMTAAWILGIFLGCAHQGDMSSTGAGAPPPGAVQPPVIPQPPVVPQPPPAVKPPEAVWWPGTSPVPGGGASLNSMGFPNLPPYVWEPLTRTFEKQARGIGANQWKTIYDKYLAHPKIPVRVAVVDLAAAEQAPPIRSIHSTAVMRVISSLVCQDVNSPECRARVGLNSVRPMDGLAASPTDRPMERAVETPKSAGHPGVDSVSFRHFYETLVNVLEHWRPDQEHLVIDIALAWDPIKTDPDDANITPIRTVLRRASCMGAILVAPAGNLTGTDGPMLPAAFETEKAPTPEECAGMGFPKVPKSREAYSPLVHAVGALDALDQRLVTVRTWGQPRLAALGLSVTAPGPADMPYSPILTGGSLSAAIVTGVAASVWAAQPHLDAHQVMALVYQGGVPLDGGVNSKRAQTEFCMGRPFGPCREFAVHRVFMCGALAKALPKEKFACVQTPSTSADLPQLPANMIPPNLPPPPAPCRVTGCGHAFGPMDVQVPMGAVPQPGIAGCPGCTLARNAFGPNQGLVYGAITWQMTPPPMIAAVVRTYNIYFQQIGDYGMQTWSSGDFFMRPLNSYGGIYAAILIVSYMYGGLPYTQAVGLNVN